MMNAMQAAFYSMTSDPFTYFWFAFRSRALDRSVGSYAALVLLLGLLCGQERAWGQELRNVPYTWAEGIKGQASYQVRAVGKDTMLVGPWRFEASWIDTTVIGKIGGLELEGHYDQQGRKAGPWTYRKRSLVTDTSPMVRGYQVVQNASGEEFQILGHFDAGKATGNWKVQEMRIRDSQAIDTLDHIKGTMANGHLSGRVHGRWDHATFSFEVNDEGLLHGDWTIDHPWAHGKPLREHRSYQHGVLVEHHMEWDGRRASINHIGLDSSEAPGEEWVVIPVDVLYHSVVGNTIFGLADGNRLSGMLAPDSLSKVLTRSHATISAAFRSLQWHGNDSVWAALPGSGTTVPAYARVRRYAFDNGEREALVENGQLLQECRVIIKELLNDPQVDLGRHAHQEVALAQEVLRTYQERLHQLGRTVEILADPSFEYIDRQTILPHLLPVVSYPDSVTYVFKGEQRTAAHAFPPALLREASSLEAISEHLDLALQDLRRVATQVDQVLERYRKESILSEKEELLIRKRDSLLLLYSEGNLSEEYNEHHRAMSPAIRTMVQHGFSAYASLPLEEKLVRIDPMLACYDEAMETYELVALIPLRLQRIEDIYTRSVWNPYTFTFMDERIKERVFRAYDQTLLPYHFSRLYERTECGQMLPAARAFVRLYQRMVELREQDTKDLERDLRRINGVDEVMIRMGLPDEPMPRTE